MHSNDIKLATQLLRLTIENKIEWRISHCPQILTVGTDSIVPTYMEAVYNDRIFSVYEIRYQSYNPDFDTMYWSGNLKLAILDKDHNSIIWENSQPISAIKNLFSYAQEQSSGIENIIEGLV